MHFAERNYRILVQISLKSVPYGQIKNTLAFVEIMAWCRTGGKPLSEPMMASFTDAYMRYTVSIS